MADLHEDWVFVGPIAVTTPGAGLYQIKELLKLGGWTVRASGTGNSGSSATSDLWTNATIPQNLNSWIRIGKGTREFVVQLLNLTFGEASGNGDCTWRYSKATGFSIGGNATTLPTATDQQDFDPGVNRGVGANQATMQFYGGVNATSEGYAFWCGLTDDNASTSWQFLFFFDEIVTIPVDPDPVIISCQNLNTGNAGSSDSTALSGESANHGFSNNTWRLDWITHNPLEAVNGHPSQTTTFFIAPFIWIQDVTNRPKGVSRWFRWLGVNDGGETTDRRQTYMLDGETCYMRVSEAALPWNAAAPVPSGWTDGGDLFDIASALGAVDEDAPVIENVSPAAGTSIARTDAVSFDFRDESGLAAVAVSAAFTGRATEVVYDGADFAPGYLSSTVEALEDGLVRRFTIRRDGGWPSAPTLRFLGVDSGGNLAVLA